LKGFKVNGNDISIPKNCDNKKVFEQKLFFLLAKREKKDTIWKKYLTDCKNFLDGDFAIINSLSQSVLETEQSFENQLTLLGVTKKKKRKLIKIYNKKRNLKNERKIIAELRLLIDSFEKPQSSAETYKKIDHWKKVFKGSRSLFLKKLSGALIALKARNRAKLKREIEGLISLSPLQVSSEFNSNLFLDSKTYQSLVIKIMKSIDLIEEGLGDKKLVQILAAHLSFIIKEESYLNYARDKGANWTLTEIGDNLNSHTYGKRFPGAWLWRLQGGLLFKDIDKYLKKSLGEDNSFNIKDSDLWVLNYHFPSGDKNRKSLIKRLLNNWNSPSYALKQVVIDLIHVPTIKKLLAKKKRSFKKPSFSIERKFYKEAMYKGDIIERSFFHLMKLGEREEDMIWWLAL